MIGDHVIKLRRGLVVLRGPGAPAVNGDRCPAVIAVDQALGIVRVNPQSVMVAMRRRQQVERAASIGGAEHPRIQHVDRVGRFRIGEDVAEVPRALAQPPVFIHADPVFSAVIGTVEPAFFRFHHGVNLVGVRP